MNIPQTHHLSLLSARRLREIPDLATPNTQQKRPRVHLPHQTDTTDASFSFHAGIPANVNQEQTLAASPPHHSFAAASTADQQQKHDANPPLQPNVDPLPPAFQTPPVQSQPPRVPLADNFDASTPDIEVITLDEDDGPQPSPQTVEAALPSISAQPEIIDLDDDDALANLQPLPTTTHTRLHISRGGGLFREQSSGQLEIVDSDDEEELTRTHRLVGREDGLHTISSVTEAIRQPMQPTVQQPIVSPTRDPDHGEHETLTPNQHITPDTQVALPPSHTFAAPTSMHLQANSETPQAFQTSPVISSVPFSTPTIARWPQPSMNTHMSMIQAQQQAPGPLSTAFPLQGFTSGAASEPLRHQTSSVIFPYAQSTGFPDGQVLSSGVGSLNETAWLNAPHGLLDPQQRIALAQTFGNPANAVFPSAAINPSATSIPPTQILHHNVPLRTEYQASGGSLPAADNEGLSAEGLRNLVKQNGLTADATEEADNPPELNVSLMPHQRRALHWMSKREMPVESDEEVSAVDEQCLGGILADDQGLGKTLTMIALMLKNRPRRDAAAQKEEDKTVTSDESVDLEKENNDEDEDELKNRPRRDAAAHKKEDKTATSDESIDLEKESSDEDDYESERTSDDDDFVAPDPSENTAWKTLIVCPVSVLNQWKEEICSRVRAAFVPQICIYHGPKRERRVSVLENCDVVITTYATLVTEYPKVLKDHPEFLSRKKAKLPLPTRSKGPLCRISWNRVVLDEAQHVKNHLTDSWSAVMSLKSEKRWCLTGTPIQNSVDDIYSLFRFIRYQFVPNYEIWNTRWKKKLEHSSAVVRERAFKRFQTIVGVVLLRRTKKDTIKGAPLITLPKRITEIEEPDFCDKEEEDVYRAVQEKSVLTFNKFLVAGTLANNYSSVLLVLLRLRQACSHPFLIEYAGMHNRGKLHSGNSDEVASDRYSTNYSSEELEEAMELVAGGYSLLSMIEDVARQRVQAALMPPAKGTTPTTRISCQYCQRGTPWSQGSFLACGDLFCPDCCHLLRKEGKCLRCLSPIEDPNLTDVFINADDVRKEVHAGAILAEETDDSVQITASEFKAWFQLEVIKRRSGASSDTITPETTDGEVDEADEDDDDMALDQLEKSILQKKAKALHRRPVRFDCSQVEAKKQRLLKALSQHSTKIRRILDKLSEIRKRDQNEKTLIFSQWTSMLDIIEFHVQCEGHEVCRLDGSMTLSARQKQIDAFRASPTRNVFLISLHAGGTGLNLTAARNVIIADVWWNPAVEEQAIDRVHRIGQTKDVKVTRFRMKGTVEERIYAICAKKREAANGTLGVTGAQSLGRKKLSLQELMQIFGGAAKDVAQTAQRGSAAAEAANNILNYQQYGGT